MLDWQTSPKWTDHHKTALLAPENSTEKIPDVTLSEIIEKSSHFPVEFPIESVRCCQLINKTSERILEKHINSAYPVIHEYGLYLCVSFLLHQRKFGQKAGFYRNISLIQLIDRLLHKRAVVFLGPADDYVLISGVTGSGKWETVGTAGETPPLTLDSCLSYDEIKLSALLSVSSHSYLINDGNRYNDGIFEKNRGKIEENGVIIGLIGARLEKPNVMEYREVILSREQNTNRNGYGNFEVPTLQGEFCKFYGGCSDTYDQIETNKDRYIDLGRGVYFDRLTYERRIALSIDTLLIEANARAKNDNTWAYVHVVGLGLGVWKISDAQNKIFMDTFATRLELLGDVLTNISDVRFSYIRQKTAGKYKDGDRIKGIKLEMADRNPHEKLTGDDKGKLLVVAYAWDGNALPGNEFWLGSLSGSGDPAAACSTQVAELHNSHINRKVRAGNLKIATLQGLVTFQEYQNLHRND